MEAQLSPENGGKLPPWKLGRVLELGVLIYLGYCFITLEFSKKLVYSRSFFPTFFGKNDERWKMKTESLRT